MAAYKTLEDGTWFAEIPKFPGVWANGKTVESCRKELWGVFGRVVDPEIMKHNRKLTLSILGALLLLLSSRGMSQELPITQITTGRSAGEAYFSSDGKHLIVLATTEEVPKSQVFIVGLTTKRMRRFIEHEGEDACPYFSPDGRWVVFASTMHDPSRGGNYSKPDDYPIAAEIYIARADGTALKRLTFNDAYEAEVSFSPDGKKLLFTSNRDGNLELYLMNTDGGNQARLTFTEDLQEGGAFFMPDGKEIVYRAWKKDNPDHVSQIYMIGADGKDNRPITHDRAFNWSPYPSPDGRYIVYASDRDERGNYEIYLMNADGTRIQRLTFNPKFDSFPVFAPDGKTINFTSIRGGPPQIYLMDLRSLPQR